MEQLILKAFTGMPYDAELQFVCDFYKDDLSRIKLDAQLPLLRHLVEEAQDTSAREVCVREVVHILAKLSVATFSNV